MEGSRTAGLLALLWVKGTQCCGKLWQETPMGAPAWTPVFGQFMLIWSSSLDAWF